MEDFRGKRIGVTRGSTSYYGLLKALSNKGISKDEISLLILSPSDQLGAMLNGDVDGVAVWQPWIEKLKSVAGARTIGVESDYGVYTGGAAYAIGAKYLEENPEAARRFMRAIVKAYDYIQENGPDIPIRIIGDSMGLEKKWHRSCGNSPRRLTRATGRTQGIYSRFRLTVSSPFTSKKWRTSCSRMD
ncbi:MAG: NrtA/SsuA/CpmA family ABC transporter substrate-binding protein [Gammaproteobacteria bacterium]|nr:NrtA/SsuA/CpmA family ABC transporter substrate-binding protein [Gammaproteobacteria bacterium]